MATRRISSLLSRSFVSSSSSCLGKNSFPGRGLCKYSTTTAIEDPIKPPVKAEYTQLLIDGKFVDAASVKKFRTLDPRTGEVIAHVAQGDAEDINRAVSAARKAFDEGPWPKMTAYERSLILLRFADLVEKHSDEIAALETWDNGKPYQQSAKIEVPICSEISLYNEPIGVAGQIIPWNFPLLMYSWKVGPALATGNTVVLKTAEQTPLSALFVTKLLHEAGLPPGVLNVVSGFGATAGAALAKHMDVDKAGLPPGVLNVVSGFGATAGAALAKHMDVDKIAFTGSTDTGKIVLELACKSNLKPVTLELGGKSPFIVCEDADVDKAVEMAHFALFFNQGQCCCAGSRTYVHERVYDEFVEKAKARAMKRAVGDPFKDGIEQGPQVDSAQFEKIMKYIRTGIESGATLETGGERLGTKGYYIRPTVFSNVKDDMLIATDEIFGPVQSILKYKDIDEVIQRANASRYGLAAGIFTQNIDTANTLTRALRVGSVWINCFDVFDATIPFGGYKMSGQGREKGIYSLSNYLQVKAVVTPLKNPAWL
ncbi:hypothetical protein TEA_016749 [Camellia sinensis var. sinensis]|uniref:Aldehyde dehydrogenase domain-containing protein n=1 Tax=Camellia sinensis var. sinensis TaxID=542762 RepID=A0A4S4ECS2_CAMSN|nr:hypothetical protein TEA_016749 [Camellia sinensis var. sinensis]